MSLPETCPGCQRAVIDVRSAVHACEDAANGTPQRCAWRALRQQAAMTSAPWPEPATATPAANSDASGARKTAAAAPAAASRAPLPSTSPVPSAASASATPPTSPADPLADARTQLAEEKAARLGLREQLRHAEAVAAESQALRTRLAAELERKNGELARLRTAAAAPPVSTPSPVPPGAPRTAGAPASAPVPVPPAAARAAEPRRGALGVVLLCLGGLVGVAVGGAGATWLHARSEPPLVMRMDETPPASQPATATAAANPASILAAPSIAPSPPVAAARVEPLPAAASTQPAPATTPTIAARSEPVAVATGREPGASEPADDLQARLRTALAGEGVDATVEIGPELKTVTVADPAANHDARARTDLVIRSLFAGAQLPEPRIEHRWISPAHAERERVASTRRTSKPETTVAAARGRRADDSGLMTLGAPAAGARAKPASSASQETRPTVLPVGRVTASCTEKASHVGLLRRSWVMWGCMRQSCCSTPHSEECKAYDKSYPLTCPR